MFSNFKSKNIGAVGKAELKFIGIVSELDFLKKLNLSLLVFCLDPQYGIFGWENEIKIVKNIYYISFL